MFEALCVNVRRSTFRTCDRIVHCQARTTHERERIEVWVAFRGRSQLPMDVFIMKEIETALFSPLRGDRAIEEIPYMTHARIVREDLTQTCRTLATRMDYLARLNNERAMTEVLLRRFLHELSGTGRLCRFLERQLGLVLRDAPWPVGMLTAEPNGLLATGQ